MIYYVILYYVRRYCINHIKLVIVSIIGISFLIYYLFFPYKYETSNNGIYGVTTLFRWVPYLSTMLLGAYIGKQTGYIRYNKMKDMFKLLVCIVSFYLPQLLAKKYIDIAPLQIITIIPLLFIPYYFYKVVKVLIADRLNEGMLAYKFILFVGNLCLESYLIQFVFFQIN